MKLLLHPFRFWYTETPHNFVEYVLLTQRNVFRAFPMLKS